MDLGEGVGEVAGGAEASALSPQGGAGEVGSTGTRPCLGAVGGAVRGERTRQGRGSGPIPVGRNPSDQGLSLSPLYFSFSFTDI